MSDAPPNPTLFIDRNTGGKSFRTAVEAAGIPIALHDDYFGHATADHEWLPEVAKRGWVTVTGDIRQRSNPLFLKALAETSAHVFLLPQLNDISFVKAECVIRIYPVVCGEVARRKPPAMFLITPRWKASLLNFMAQLENCRRHRLV